MNLQQLLSLWPARGCGCLGGDDDFVLVDCTAPLSTLQMAGGQPKWSYHKAEHPHTSWPLTCSGPFQGPVPNFVCILLCSFFLKLPSPCKLCKLHALRNLLLSLGFAHKRLWDGSGWHLKLPGHPTQSWKFTPCPIFNPHFSQLYHLSPEVLWEQMITGRYSTNKMQTVWGGPR